MIETANVYRAHYDFVNDAREYRVGDIVFTADNPAEAVRAFLRFWCGRQLAIPDHYTKLLCAKIAGYVIGPIAEDGSLTNPGNFNFFEYKRDTAGLPLAEYVEYRCAQLENTK